MPARYFSPSTIKIHVGDTVQWTNTSQEGHSVNSRASSAESFNSSTNCRSGALLFNDCIRPQQSFSHTFQSRGVFVYYCQRHGVDAPFPNCRMCGRVIVVRRSSPTVAPSASVTPSGSGSPSVSPSPTGSTTSSGTPLPGSSTLAAGPSGSKGLPTVAIAAIGVALLAGTGVIVYRTMIRRA